MKKLFFDGWVNALEDIPDHSLRASFSTALSSGKPFTPGLVCQSYREESTARTEELKRHPEREMQSNSFPFHATLLEMGTTRHYSFAFKEKPLCSECGFMAEAFVYLGPAKAKKLLCSLHTHLERETVSEEIPF